MGVDLESFQGRRGEHGAILVMMGTSGILAANLVCWAMASAWRWVLALGMVPAVLQVIWGYFVLPESRTWLQQRPKQMALARGSFEVAMLGFKV